MKFESRPNCRDVGFGDRIKKQEQSEVSSTGSGYKVLVIDDSNTIRRSAEIFLKQGGHEVMLAEDGFDALSKINDYHPSVIF